MKKLFGLLLLLHVSLVLADDDCPMAADAAEAQNPNAHKNCDYSKSGLNGMLHRAFKEDATAGTDEKATIDSSTIKIESQLESAKNSLAAGEFTTAQQLQALRYTLIQKAAAECTKGFVVEGERYLPKPLKAMKLELIYHCL